MDLTTQRAYQYGSGGDGWETGSGSNTLDRSFSIWFNDNAPAGSDDTNGGGLQLGTAATMWRDMGSTFFNSRQAPAIIFINENESDGYVNCYTNSSVFNTYENWFLKSHYGRERKSSNLSRFS